MGAARFGGSRDQLRQLVWIRGCGPWVHGAGCPKFPTPFFVLHLEREVRRLRQSSCRRVRETPTRQSRGEQGKLPLTGSGSNSHCYQYKSKIPF